MNTVSFIYYLLVPSSALINLNHFVETKVNELKQKEVKHGKIIEILSFRLMEEKESHLEITREGNFKCLVLVSANIYNRKEGETFTTTVKEELDEGYFFDEPIKTFMLKTEKSKLKIGKTIKVKLVSKMFLTIGTKGYQYIVKQV
jgi:hypothetical protein